MTYYYYYFFNTTDGYRFVRVRIYKDLQWFYNNQLGEVTRSETK